METPRRSLTAFTRIGSLAVAVSLLGWTLDRTLLAFNYVVDANGTYWGIQDAASPGVDTGSIRATQVAPGGNNEPFSTQINGFGGIKVLVETTRPPRFNGELMRGFGLTFDGADRFATTTSVGLGGVTISRSVYVNRSANYGRWLDSFTNTTGKTLRIKVAFGGQSGIGTGATSTTVVNTSSGDALITAEDSWVEVATPLAGATLVGGPQITVIGTPSTPAKAFSGAMTFAGNWLLDSFNDPLVYTGHEANFQAYVNTLTIPPGKSRSLLHFVVLGPRVDATTSAAERAEIELTAKNLVMAPDISGLTAAEVCTIRNFDVDALTASGFDYDRCIRRWGRRVDVVAQPPVPKAPKPVTTSDYDVVEKTIGQLRRDMERGRDDLAGNHARVPGSDRRLRQRSVRIPRVRDRRRQRHEAGQGRRSRARPGRARAAARHPDRDQEQLRHVRHADDERQLHVRGIPSRARRVPGG